ncbi:hypothetical protein BCR34DRAFT_600334 [Clohesyomyces aquaticus]|uniref:LysM domain-containing protein n=1 Tax=Clohesyomyces aquaticus TaxID=1231657 RepID=A0A1Y1ZRG8_9PLEO|nr:hypothetical protein BCR34DRAFT_600334 [Clohesyomyces aquaticus]
MFASWTKLGLLAIATCTTALNIPRQDPSTFPQPHQPHIISNCNAFYLVKSGDFCQKIVNTYKNFTLDDFYTWNPDVPTPKRDCSNLLANYYVCVGTDSTMPTTTTTTASPTTTTTTSTATSTSTPGGCPSPPSPIQPGITFINCCSKFYFVERGDTCVAIEKKFGFSDNIFRHLTQGIDPDCYDLEAGYYVCVGR